MIRRDRKNVTRPACLDPASAAMISELAHNTNVVSTGDAAGVHWKGLAGQLSFNMYANDPEVKKNLSKLFGNKCAYCEKSLDGQDLHTEHFRPKGGVSVQDDPLERGYWWLGAIWENLLPACLHCNRSPGTDYVTGLAYGSGKGTRFPLCPNSPRAILPHQIQAELPVLLDPTEDEPSEYFTFKSLNNNSFAVVNHLRNYTHQLRALGSIEIYGLNNYALVRARTAYLKGVAIATRAYIDSAVSFNKSLASGDAANVLDIKKMAAEDAFADLYDNYLSLDKPFIYAAIRCIESELQAVRLNLKHLLAGRSCFISAQSLL